jgi:hypothetical protein
MPATQIAYDHYKQRVSSYEWKPDQARYSQELVNSHWAIRAGAILPILAHLFAVEEEED